MDAIAHCLNFTAHDGIKMKNDFDCVECERDLVEKCWNYSMFLRKWDICSNKSWMLQGFVHITACAVFFFSSIVRFANFACLTNTHFFPGDKMKLTAVTLSRIENKKSCVFAEDLIKMEFVFTFK